MAELYDATDEARRSEAEFEPTIQPTRLLELRQEPLPKAHDPYEWTGWPLFEMYGLTGYNENYDIGAGVTTHNHGVKS